MNKFKLMLALLGASSMVLASCGGGEDPTPEVEKKITSVSVSCGKTLEVGKTVTAKANVVAEGGASKDVTWSSSDETVATVDSNGVVTGKKAGKVTITATSTFDSTKSGFVEIDVVSPDWSSGVKKAMQDTLGMVLPYFEGAFTWAEDEETGGLVAESSNAADTEKVIAAYDALQLPKSVEEDYVEYKLSTSSEDYAVIVDVYAEDEKAYVSANLVMIKWPAGKIAEALEGYTTLEPESVPAAEGTQFNFMLDEEYNFSCYVLVVGSLEAYTTKLLSEGWTIVQIDQEYGITILLSPKSSLVMQIMALDDESFMFNVYATGDPVEPILEWPAEQVAAYIGEHTEETIPAAEGTKFVVTEKTSGYNALLIDVTGSTAAAYLAKLEAANWVIEDYSETYGYYECYSPEGYLELAIFPMESGFEIQLLLTNPPAVEWPAEQVAAYIGEHTEETVPAAEGTSFSVSEKTSPYNALIIDITGDSAAYLAKLEAANWVIEDYSETYGYYECYSPEGYLELAIFPGEGNFEIQLILANPPAVEWPAEEVAAFCEGYTEVEIPAAVGTEFYVNKLDPASSYGYFGVVQVLGGVCADYLETLRGAGFSVEYDEENDFYFAIKDNLELDIFDRSGYFAIQAAVYVDPTIWPAETIASFLEGHTEVEVPAATGDSFKAQASTGYYYGQVIVFGGVVADYCSTLEGAGFEVGYDETNECYTAHKDDLAIDIYEYPTYMGLGFYTYVAPVAEWPADLVAALLDGKTEVSIPEADGTSFVVAPLTGFYFGSITISGGDMDAYLETLRSAEFSVAWDSEYECYVAAKDNLLMDIGENPDVEGEFQMLLYLKAAFPTADVAAAVEALVPGSETVIPEFEAEEYQLQDARAYIGAFVLYAEGDSSLLNEYIGILDDAKWAVSELEEGVYGAVSPAEDIMLQISYSDYYGELNVYIMTYTKPATEWPADEVAALVESIEAEGTVPAADGLSFTCYEAQGYYPPQINVGVEEGTAEAAVAAYLADLEDAGFFLVMSSYGYDYYAEEGNTLALCVYAYGDSEFIIELGCLASPAVKPLTEWPADAVAAIVEGIGAEGSAVPAFEGEGISFNVGSYYLTVNPGANDPEDLLASYITKLEGLGYFVCGDNYGDPIFALEGETLGISPYYYNGSLCVELMKLDSPAAPAVFPTAAVEAFFDGKTDEVVPAIAAYDFKTSDNTSYLEIKAYGGNVKDYMKVLSDAGWTADYDSSAYYNYATSPEGSIKMTLINYTSYVTLKLEYVPPKLTEWPADAIAEALGEKAKTTLPGITGEGLQFEFTDNGDDSMKLDVYGSTPSAYVSILEDAGFTVTEGSPEDQYWYLLSADKTVKVQVYDYMSAGQDYFRVKAYGQDPTWTGTSFDPAVVEEALGLSEGFIPAIADGTKFSFSQPSDNSFKVTVESGANYDNFIAALGEAGFEETSAGSNTFTKDNVVATVKIENPITQKYSVEYTVQSSPTPQGEWPLDQIKALLGDERGELLPEAVGATSVIVTGSDGDCNISITGVSAETYKQALLDAGFSFDGMSYSKGDLYVDVTGSGDSCTVNAYYFNF